MKYVPVVPREYWPELRGQVGAVAVAEPAAEDTDYIVVDIVAVVNMYDLRIEFAVVAVASLDSDFHDRDHFLGMHHILYLYLYLSRRSAQNCFFLKMSL